MTMPYPNNETYARLYARYLKGERTRQLLDEAGNLEGKHIVDLCGGGGRLSMEAARRGALVTLVDESPEMLQGVGIPGGITVYRDVHTWLHSFAETGEYDVLFCQQAVNYWFEEELVHLLAQVLKPGGKFIFNTFNREPSAVPTIKQYELDGVKYAEASWLVGGTEVHHVQMREGEPPHTTKFWWISPEEFEGAFAPHFDAVEKRDGAASVWVCTRKP